MPPPIRVSRSCIRDTPPPVFCAKRRERGSKRLKTMDLPPRQGRGRQRRGGTEFGGGLEACTPTPRGNADGYQNKGVAGKAIRKNMKTKGRQKQSGEWRVGGE